MAIAVFALLLSIPYRTAMRPLTPRRRNEALLLEGMALVVCVASGVGARFTAWTILVALSSLLTIGLLRAAPVTGRELVI
jgi:hypothetical protein